MTLSQILAPLVQNEQWEERINPHGVRYYFYCDRPRDYQGDDAPNSFDEQTWRIAISMAGISLRFDMVFVNAWRAFLQKLGVTKLLSHDAAFDAAIYLLACDTNFLERLKDDQKMREEFMRLIKIGITRLTLTDSHLIFTITAAKNSIPLPCQETLNRLVDELLRLKKRLSQ